MKIIIAKSCKQLFLKCIMLTVILNIIIYLVIFSITNHEESYYYYYYFGLRVLHLCLSLYLGLYIRKNNKSLILKEEEERVHYIKVTLVGSIIMLIITCNPDIIAIGYTMLQDIFYKYLGLDGIFSFFNFYSILICLWCVFFKTKRANSRRKRI